MAYRTHELGLLLRLDPERAARRIVAEYRRTHGNTRQAAERLGVDHATLKRWLLALENRGVAVREQIAAIRAAAA